MRSFALSAFLLSTLASLTSGHGQLHRVITHSPIATYVAANASGPADPTSPIRKLSDVGPAAPFTGANITCGSGGNIPVSNLAPVVAGSQVTFDWNPWTSYHPGPIMTYIARCPNGCANFKGDTGNVWIKIAEDGYNPNRTIGWAEENIRSFGNYTLTIPASLASGEYLLRHEILGLQLAGIPNGAEFYPTCIQIKLTGGGSATPTGVALPGAYKTNDPGIFMQLYTFDYQHPNYTIPGGPVILQGGPGYYGNAPTTTTTTSKAGYTTSK